MVIDMKKVDVLNRYPWQFRIGREIDHSVPESWLPTIADLCAAIDELVGQDVQEQFYWRDIKEKRGQLAVDYVAPAVLADTIEALVDAAESDCRKAGQTPPTNASNKWISPC